MAPPLTSQRTSMHDAKSGDIKMGHLEGNIIETVYRGHISAHLAGEVLERLDRLLVAHPGADWLIDATAATGISAAPQSSRLAVFDLFQQRGGRQVAAVVRSSALRMMAATFSFAFGLRMKTFEQRDAALIFLRSLPPR